LTAEEFVNSASKAVTLSENLGMPVNELPNYITQKELELEELEGEIEGVKMKRELVLKNYDITMNDLEEYRINKPFLDRIRQLKQIINNLVREIKSK
jgi:hypothetical protein